MAATANWCEDHGTATGSPAKGTTRDGFGADTNYAVNCNWKTADDTNVTAYTAAPVGPKPDCSYEKYQYIKFGGTFTLISAVKWTCHNNPEDLAYPDSLDGHIKLMGRVSSVYETPTRSINPLLTTDFSRQVWAYQGLPVNMHTTGPEASGPTDTLTAAGYTQYLISQIQALNTATFSSTAETMTVVAVWSEA